MVVPQVSALNSTPLVVFDQFNQSKFGPNALQSVGSRLLIVNDNVQGLTLINLNSDGTSSTSESPEYLSVPITNEKVIAFGVFVLGAG